MSTFQEKVYSVVRKIPKGKVMTYGEVAKKIGLPKSARAVGSVLSKNYDPQIPCHRVIRSDGKIGNYNRGGMKAKSKILKTEGIDAKTWSIYRPERNGARRGRTNFQ